MASLLPDVILLKMHFDNMHDVAVSCGYDT